MARRRLNARVVLPVLIPFLVFVGCARKPVSMTSAVPAPTGTSKAALATPPAKSSGGASSMAAVPKGAAPAALSEYHPAGALKDIHFDFDKYDIKPADAKVLDDNAAWLKGNAKALLLVEGHADERGTNEYNLALGDRRAKATMTYLLGQGVAASRISVISYGEERPVCTAHTEECWAQNRRAHFLVKSE